MISLRGVSHRYGDREVLSGVDLDLGERRVGVVGANGSGKSTLARMVNGLVVPTQGTVTVGGLDTRTDGAAVRRRGGGGVEHPPPPHKHPHPSPHLSVKGRRTRPAPRISISANCAMSCWATGPSTIVTMRVPSSTTGTISHGSTNCANERGA